NDLRVINLALGSVLEEIVIHFARAKDNPLHFVSGASFWRAKDFFEPAMDEFFGGGGGQCGAQQTFRRHYDQRLDEVALHLASQHVKILCRSSEIAHLDIIFGARLQKTLQSGAGVFRSLTFVAVWKQEHDPTWLLPFRFC